jgi:hypothetical protein
MLILYTFKFVSEVREAQEEEEEEKIFNKK